MSDNFNQFNKIKVSTKVISLEDLVALFEKLRDKILIIENKLSKTN